MKKQVVIIVLCCAWLAGLAPHAWAVDTDALQRLLPKPAQVLRNELSLSMGVRFVPVRGYLLYHYATDGRPDLSIPIAQKQARLRRSPGDAQAAFDLGEMLGRESENVPAQAAYARAVTLFQRQVEAQPRNPWLRTRLGVALARIGRTQDAEAALRQATLLPPSPWQAWLQWGNLLARTASAQTPERQKQTALCFGRAVAAAPHEAAPRYRRAEFRRTAASLKLHSAGDFTPYPPQAVADIDTAIQDSQDPYFITSAADGEALYASFARRGTAPLPTSDRVYDALPLRAQQSVRMAAARLRDLAQSRDGARAADAWTALSWLQYEVLYRPAQAEDSLRRALARDPSCETASSYLTHIFLSEDDDKDAALFLTQRMPRQDTLRSHVLLAVALAEQNRTGPAIDQLRIAKARAPQDSAVKLASAILYLRKPPVSNIPYTEAGLALADVNKGLNASTPAALRQEYGLTQGIYLALTGRQDEARRELEPLAHAGSDATDVNKALAILK